MGKTFILVTQEAEKLGAKHLPVFFETPCRKIVNDGENGVGQHLAPEGRQIGTGCLKKNREMFCT